MTHEENVRLFWTHVVQCAHGEHCRDCCWPWHGGLSNGYGIWMTADKKKVHAHRFMIEVSDGAGLLFSESMVQAMQGPGKPPRKPYALTPFCACHSCDYRACVNRWHLFVGTHQDNTHDAMLKHRWRNR
jgi:hypothetical protein